MSSTDNRNNNENDKKTHIEAPEHRIPPILKDCEDYQKATSVGKVNTKTRKCKYSLMYVDNKEFSLCTRSSEFAILGAGYPLFFDLVKVIAFFLFILAFPAAYLCFYNYQGNDCVFRQEMKAHKRFDSHTSPEIIQNPQMVSITQQSIEKENSKETKRNPGHFQNFSHFKTKHTDSGKSTFTYSTHKVDFNRFAQEIQDTESLLTFYISVYCRYKWYDFDDLDCKHYLQGKCRKYLDDKYTPIQAIPAAKASADKPKPKKKPNKKLDGKKLRSSKEIEAKHICERLIRLKFKKLSKGLACLKTFTNEVSLANWGDYSNDTERERELLNSILKRVDAAAIMVLLAFMTLFLTYYNKARGYKYDKEVLSIQDFSVMLHGLPSKGELEGDYKLKEIIKTEIEMYGFKVAQINFVYDTAEYIRLRKEYEKLIVDYKKDLWRKGVISEQKQDLDEVSLLKDAGGEISAKSAEILQRLKELEDAFESGSTQHMSGKAFVSFETYNDAQRFLEERSNNSFVQNFLNFREDNFDDMILRFEGKEFFVYAEQAKEPNDIIWENQSVSLVKKIRIWITFALIEVIMVIAGFFVVCLFQMCLTHVRLMLNDRENQTGFEVYLEVALGYLGGILIMVIDEILILTVMRVADYARPRTFTEKHKIVASTLWKLQFMNNAIVPLLYSWTILNFFGRNGLVEKMNSVLLAAIYMSLVFRILLHKYRVWKIFRIASVKRFIKTGKGTIYTQKEANEIFEKLAWGISRNYASVIKSFMVSVFYLPIIPLSVFYNLGFLLVFYWVCKFNLTKRSNKIFRFSNQISTELIPQFKWSLPIFVLGLFSERVVILFMNLMDIEFTEFLIYCLVAAIAFFFLVDLDLIVKPCFRRKAKENADVKFEVVRRENVQDYDYMNPATSKRAKTKDGEFNAVFYKKDRFGGGLAPAERGKLFGGRETELGRQY